MATKGTKKETIGVFFGSRSPEHDVSIITGELVISGLKRLGHEIVPVYISPEGVWYTHEKLGRLEFFKDGSYKKKLKRIPVCSLLVGEGRGKLVLETKNMWGTKRITIDVAFPAFHGPYGEDGTIQGLFELVGVPYVGSGPTSSALGMDKVFTKLLYERFKIPTPKFFYFTKDEWRAYQDKIVDEAAELGFPVFVKPARAGSSIGIARIDEKKALVFAIDVAFHYDDKVLVERAVEDVIDITVAVLGNEKPVTSLLQESIFEGDFFTYDSKYLEEGGAQLGAAKKNIIIPARLDEKTSREIQEMAVEIYSAFECRGTARVDFLVDRKTGKVYANEINTMPGTLYHHLWKESGVTLEKLLAELVRLSKRLHAQKEKITYTFDSEILKRANTKKLSMKLEEDVLTEG